MKVVAGDVEKTLDAIGIKIEEVGDELYAPCPMHKSRTGHKDRNPSWSINRETGLHSCFSCGYKGNLFTLARDLGFAGGLARLTKGQAKTPDDDWPTIQYSRPKLPKSYVREMPESSLALFVPPFQDVLDRRRLYADTVDKYGVLWDVNIESWVFPLRSPTTDRLIGYQLKAENGRFFKNYPIGLRKGSTLFGFKQAVDSGTGRVVVVESPLDALLLAGWGIPTVAVCGSKVTKDQVALLRIFTRVVLALDDDAAGQRETNRLMRERTGLWMTPVEYTGRWKDFGDMPESEAMAILDKVGAC